MWKQLDARAGEAAVDRYGEAEQVSGFFTLVEDRLTVPFGTRVLGAGVSVGSVDPADGDQIVAACSRGRSRQGLLLLGLPARETAPQVEWAGACRSYRAWAGAQGA